MGDISYLCNDLWRLDLCKYANRLSQGKWKPWSYLSCASDIVQKAIYRGNGRVIINMPPRHGKSELFSHWLPVWYLDMFPTNRILFTSYGGEFASEWGRTVRDELRDNPFTISKPRRDVSAVVFWKTTAGGMMKTAGVDGPIVGRGGDLIIIDDPYKDWKEALSTTIQKTTIDWFNKTLRHRFEPGATVILIQTRWHENDLTGYLLNNHNEKWDHIRFPALAEEEDILGRKEGDALCPERYSREELLRMQEHDPLMFAGLFQQRPSVLEGNIIKRDWIQTYQHVPDNLEDHLQSWDFTFKKTGMSYVVGQVWGKDGANIYLLDQIRGKMDYVEARQAIRAMSYNWPKVLTKLVEDKANGPAIISDLKNELSGIIPIPVNAGDSKTARLSSVASFFQARNIWIPENKPWTKAYIEALVNFPNHSSDDEADATSQALSYYKNNVVNISYKDLDFSFEQGKRVSPWKFDHAGY